MVRKLVLPALAALLVGASFLLAACPASHGEYPSTSCSLPADCFKGEQCVSGECKAAGSPTPSDGGADATPMSDGHAQD